jgi:Na+/melibiose symporter-like transporter
MTFIQFLPTFLQALIVIAVFAGTSIVGLMLIRRRVDPQRLRDDHDVAGFTFGVVGAFYGVVLAFVIVAAWQRFERATETAQRESLAISNLFSLSQGLSEPQRSQMQAALRAYTSRVINHEFSAMQHSDFHQSMEPVRRLWAVLLNLRRSPPPGPEQQTIFDKSIDQMAELSDARQLRYMYYSEDLPSVVWLVIYVGCFITLGFGYFFGTRNLKSQALMVGTFAALIGLTILAISELATPYQGAVVVPSDPFRFVLRSLSTEPGPPGSGVNPSSAR